MLAKWIMTHIVMMAISKLTAFAQSKAAAGVGAAEAGSAVAGIPIVGPALVAPAASATFAVLMGFGAIGSAARGMDVLRDQYVHVHKNEMILPENIAQNFRAASPRAALAGAGGHTFNMPIYGATDPKAVGDQVMERVQRFFSTGGVMKG